MRFIGFKIFSIAVGLLVLMGAAALLSLHMTRTVDDQLQILDQNYYPAYVSLAHANIHTVEESAFIRRLILALDESPRDEAKIADLRERVKNAGSASDDDLTEARRHINEQIGDPRNSNGVGLGLAVTKGFVEAMGGKLSADATPGGGLTMRIELPTSSPVSDPAGEQR